MKTNFKFNINNLKINEKMNIESLSIDGAVEINAEELIQIYKGEKELFELLSSTVVTVVKELNKK